MKDFLINLKESVGKKEIIVFFIAIAFLSFLLIIFRDDSEITEMEGSVLSQERVRELEELKKESFYDEDFIENLGWTEEEISDMYGEPDEIRDDLYGEIEFYYEELNVSFIFSRDDNIVVNLFLYPGAEVFNIEVGMTFDEIEDFLGRPYFRGHDLEKGGYSMNYFFSQQDDSNKGLDIWIEAQDDNSPTRGMIVSWKR